MVNAENRYEQLKIRRKRPFGTTPQRKYGTNHFETQNSFLSSKINPTESNPTKTLLKECLPNKNKPNPRAY